MSNHFFVCRRATRWERWRRSVVSWPTISAHTLSGGDTACWSGNPRPGECLPLCACVHGFLCVWGWWGGDGGGGVQLMCHQLLPLWMPWKNSLWLTHHMMPDSRVFCTFHPPNRSSPDGIGHMKRVCCAPITQLLFSSGRFCCCLLFPIDLLIFT